ncbi:MAG TPA: ABC transporter permease [Polyangiales bacterium]|nr:ABC transporter permease [Polyangiales bacterium]
MRRDTLPPILELTLARLREFWRDPGALFWTFGFPLVLAVALGLAFRSQPAPALNVALVCEPACTDLAHPLTRGGNLAVAILREDEAMAALRKAKLDLVLIPRGPSTLEYHFDPTRPEGKAARATAELALDPTPTPRFRSVELASTLPGARYIDFLLPGLLGVNLMSSSVWGIAFSIVESRRRKLLKQLSATPMRKRDYLAAVMLARLLFVSFEVFAILGFGALAFSVPVHGSWLAAWVLAMFGSLAFTGVALLVSARARSIEAVSGWSNLTTLPMWLLSGVFFSYERFPEWLWPTLRWLPLTALNSGLRAIVNDGRALSSLGFEILVLIVWSVLTYAIALRIFRWQ